MNELRRFPRVKLSGRVKLGDDQTCKTKDISQTGINLISDLPLHKSSPLLMEIPFSRNKIIKTAGIILWSQLTDTSQWENGIKFFSIDQDGRLELKNYIDKCLFGKSERRTRIRHNLDIHVRYSIKTKCRTKDITQQGMRILTKKALPEGQIIQLSIRLSKSKINTTGRVIWTKALKPRLFEQGIEFWDIEEESIKALAEYFDKKATGIPSIEEIRLQA
ncbi:MAG: PilZ domain-containing protein [Spirochaetales bacterium]|nr:PilZ domain-containing protein [Spirochaetales bacterium]